MSKNIISELEELLCGGLSTLLRESCLPGFKGIGKVIARTGSLRHDNVDFSKYTNYKKINPNIITLIEDKKAANEGWGEEE